MRALRRVAALALLGLAIGSPSWADNHEIRIEHTPLPVDPAFPSPAPTLRVIAAEGGATALEQVRPGAGFYVEARFIGQLPATESVELGFDGLSAAPLRLERTAEPGLYRSARLAVRPPRAEEERLGLARTAPGHDAQRSARVAAEHFAGEWKVVVRGEDGAQRTGIATIAADGLSATLVVGDANAANAGRRFRSLELDAVLFPGGGPGTPGGLLTVRFEEGTAASATVAPATELEPGPGRRVLHFSQGEARAQVGVATAQRTMVRLARKGRNRLEGPWNEEKDDREYASLGRQAWTRGTPRIDGIIVLEDQLRKPAAGTVGLLSTTGYPFRPQAEARASKKRTLFVYGENLPEHGDLAQVEGLSPFIAYAPEEGTLKDQGWRRAGIQPTGDLGALILSADLSPGVVPGFKALRINGAHGEWPLLFNDQHAVLRFVRESGDALTDATDVFYTSDVAYLELVYGIDLPLRQVMVQVVLHDEDDGPLEALPALRVPGQARPTYRTGPIHLYDLDHPELSPGGSAWLRVGVRHGTRLTAQLRDPAAGLLLPPAASARVRADPAGLGPSWAQAVERAMQCYGADADALQPPEKWALQPALTVEKRILTEWLRLRKVELRNGDHAAAILLRDEFVRHAREVAAAYLAAAANLGEVRAFRARASAAGSARGELLWTRYKATYTARKGSERVPTEVPLWHALEWETRGKAMGMSSSQAEVWSAEQIRLALRRLHGDMQASVARAAGAGDCRLQELLVLVGHDGGAMAARIIPRLVRLKGHTGAAGSRWAPDPLAIGFVKGLRTPAEAVRALNEYAAIDDAYKAMALALVTGGAAAALTKLGAASAAAWTLIAGDAADIAVFGVRGVLQYREGEADFVYAKGAAPLFGLEFAEDAEAARQSGFFTALGLIAPGLSGAMGLRHLKNLRAAQRGKDLLARHGLDDLARLGDAQRSDIASYYTDLLDRARRTGVDGLDPAERAALAQFEAYFRGAGVAPPSSARLAAGGERAYRRWKDGLSDETQAMLDANPSLGRVFAEMPREVRSLLTRCDSPCIPPGTGPADVKRIQALLSRLKPGKRDVENLKTYFHERAGNLPAAIAHLEAAADLRAMRELVPQPGRMLGPVRSTDLGGFTATYQVGDSIERAGMESYVPRRSGRHRAHAVPPGHGVEHVGGMTYSLPRNNLGIDQRYDNQIRGYYRTAKREGNGIQVTVTIRRYSNGDIAEKELESYLVRPDGSRTLITRLGYEARLGDGKAIPYGTPGPAFSLFH